MPETFPRVPELIGIKYRVIIAAAGVLLGLFMAWYFFNILIYIVLAGVISLIGQPLVDLFSRIRFGRFTMPKSISALLAIILLLGLLAGFVMLIVPMITRQANVISQINVDELVAYFAGVIDEIQRVMLSYDIIDTDQTLQSVLEKQIRGLINATNVSNIFVKLVNATSTIFIGSFSVLFLSFFFLRDRGLLKSGILLITPDRFQQEVQTILHKTKIMLSRYFIGLLSELLIMMTLISIGLTIFGIKNAVLIGFIGGLMNVIPYLGPIIGATIGAVLGISSDLGLGLYDNALTTAVTVVLVFSVSNLIDNLVLQPLIYSKSVNAHPIEIFIVILMAGSLAGIPGMILAIPGYTVLRIVAKEFLSGFKFIDKLTENI
ncbi:MAG: AI-2E family transporter [Bacteroidales bacterium]|nr:AI-2E family transporter [Bacteroidales bacterium]